MDIKVDNDQELLPDDAVINALYRHVTNAGTPGDLGYAYQGIRQIQEYMVMLPICRWVKK